MTVETIKTLLHELSPEELAEVASIVNGMTPGRYSAGEVLGALMTSNLWEDESWNELIWQLEYSGYEERRFVELRGNKVPVELVAQNPDGEYSYETFLVIKVGDQFFKKSGHYASHYGDDWDGPFVEVTPTTKTVTEFATA